MINKSSYQLQAAEKEPIGHSRLYWSKLVEMLKTPARSTEALAEYLSYPKAMQFTLQENMKGCV